MKVDVVNMQGEKVRTVELPPAVFEAPIKRELMYQALVRQYSNSRLGTRKTKTRAEVRGGGRKPWRQKGTGRARQGSIRAPNWAKGGKVHTPRPRDFSQSMPRKMRRAALRSALSVKAREAQIVVLEELRLEQPKTQEMAAALQRLVGPTSVLIVLADRDETVERTTRNLQKVKTLRATYLNVRDLLGYQRLLLPLGAVDAISNHLAS